MNPKFTLVLMLMLTVSFVFETKGQQAAKPAWSGIKEVIACGDDKVVIFDRRSSSGDRHEIIWEWQASEAAGLPESYKKYFSTTDECKPVGGNKLLITSSGGGAILVDRGTKETLFYAHVPNAHSAAYLPGDRIVVALSTAPARNSIQLFDVKRSDKVLFQDSLYSGHGAVWIAERERLFVLGYDVLRSYALHNWNGNRPALQKEKEWKLPDDGGHDLSFVTPNRLLLSTSNSVWNFDVASESFSPFDELKDVEHVKSANFDANTGELVYTKGEISWWTHNIYFRNPADTLKVPDINLYKIRVVR